MGSTSTIFNRCIWRTFAFDFVPGQQFYSETHESEFCLCVFLFVFSGSGSYLTELFVIVTLNIQNKSSTVFYVLFFYSFDDLLFTHMKKKIYFEDYTRMA